MLHRLSIRSRVIPADPVRISLSRARDDEKTEEQEIDRGDESGRKQSLPSGRDAEDSLYMFSLCSHQGLPPPNPRNDGVAP
jgi:hypothetical protein